MYEFWRANKTDEDWPNFSTIKADIFFFFFEKRHLQKIANSVSLENSHA